MVFNSLASSSAASIFSSTYSSRTTASSAAESVSSLGQATFSTSTVVASDTSTMPRTTLTSSLVNMGAVNAGACGAACEMNALCQAALWRPLQGSYRSYSSFGQGITSQALVTY
ncbi:hypothetical protein BKA66DRAFT_448207 [Pyrenochaeta sp. MPI-SDFR-AT-0127]|nr:hypothetical protein BKA66DRAFT_448207 [Pyrenochaeta sp. MPI-SDFR-AT-0127]